jgi:hypothetical protein
MGTRGIVGFIENGVRTGGAYNHSDSHPWGLGDAIIKFIMSLTEEQWDEMAKKVAGVSISLSYPFPADCLAGLDQ